MQKGRSKLTIYLRVNENHPKFSAIVDLLLRIPYGQQNAVLLECIAQSAQSVIAALEKDGIPTPPIPATVDLHPAPALITQPLAPASETTNSVGYSVMAMEMVSTFAADAIEEPSKQSHYNDAAGNPLSAGINVPN